VTEKESKHFFCPPCREYFRTSQWIEDQEKGPVAHCPVCQKAVHEVPHYYANLQKMWDNATGPTTSTGKKRSSLNGYKHGLRSRKLHLMAPAITGKYPECTGCPYFEECKSDFQYCPVQLGPVMQFLQAWENGQVNDLKQITGITHARVFQILSMSLQQIFEKGTLQPKKISEKINQIRSDDDDDPEHKYDHIDERTTVLEWQENPLIKRIPELMNVLGMTAEQQMMTPAKKQEQDNIEGYLRGEESKSEDLKEFMLNQKKQMQDLKDKISTAVDKRSEDRALKNYEKQKAAEKDES